MQLENANSTGIQNGIWIQIINREPHSLNMLVRHVSPIIGALPGEKRNNKNKEDVSKKGGEERRWASCGRLVVERPVKKEMDGKELVFCCEHCAAAYTKKE